MEQKKSDNAYISKQAQENSRKEICLKILEINNRVIEMNQRIFQELSTPELVVMHESGNVN